MLNNYMMFGLLVTYVPVPDDHRVLLFLYPPSNLAVTREFLEFHWEFQFKDDPTVTSLWRTTKWTVRWYFEEGRVTDFSEDRVIQFLRLINNPSYELRPPVFDPDALDRLGYLD